MEQKHGNTTLFLLSLCLGILMGNFRTKGILSVLFYFKFVVRYVSQKWKTWTETRVESNDEPAKQSLDYTERGGASTRVCKEDIVLVMEKLGMSVECDGVGVEEEFGVQEIEELFDDEGVTLSQVEKAFDVFDQNKNGYIEARELQRILSCLGLGKNMIECQKMINSVDQNGDELIDRSEFVSLMEQSFE